jgi:hypothetical protein
MVSAGSFQDARKLSPPKSGLSLLLLSLFSWNCAMRKALLNSYVSMEIPVYVLVVAETGD